MKRFGRYFLSVYTALVQTSAQKSGKQLCTLWSKSWWHTVDLSNLGRSGPRYWMTQSWACLKAALRSTRRMLAGPLQEPRLGCRMLLALTHTKLVQMEWLPPLQLSSAVRCLKLRAKRSLRCNSTMQLWPRRWNRMTHNGRRLVLFWFKHLVAHSRSSSLLLKTKVARPQQLRFKSLQQSSGLNWPTLWIWCSALVHLMSVSKSLKPY